MLMSFCPSSSYTSAVVPLLCIMWGPEGGAISGYGKRRRMHFVTVVMTTIIHIPVADMMAAEDQRNAFHQTL